MIEPMAKIEIVGLIDELDATLDFLQSKGMVEIIEIPTIEGRGHGQIHRIHLDKKKEKLLTGYEEVLGTVRELLDILGDERTAADRPDPIMREKIRGLNPDEILDILSTIFRDIKKLGRQQKNLKEDLDSARQYETLINTFLPLLEQVGTIGHREQIGIILKKAESSVLPVLKSRIDEVTGDETILLHREMPNGAIGVYIVIAPSDLDAVRELLGNEGVAEYHVPRDYRKKTLRESIESIRERIDAIPKELAAIDEELDMQRREHEAFLLYIRSVSTDRINQLRILSKLVRTKHTFIVSGWTVISSLETLKSEMKNRFGGSVYIDRVRINDLDLLHIPTKLTNRSFFRSFEVLMKLLPPPKYNSLDATPFITLFFPVFFGIILGDIAYGLLLMAIAGIIKLKASKSGPVTDAASVALIAGASTVFFGFLYGEFLGDFGEHHFGMHAVVPWLHRAAAIQVLLIIAIAIGVVHVILGFALKIYISIAIQHIKGAFEGLAKIAVILGIVGIFMQLFLGQPIFMRYISIGLIGSGLVGVALTEGFFGLIELLSMFGNILSYSRIMAIGVASVILAIVANRLAEASHNIVLALIIGTIIHLVNFIMGVFSPTIHSLRLHYVEFFTKFLDSSGKSFQPFRKISS